MPLSAAERQKRYRERLKNNDPDKWNRIQEKNLTRAKKFYKKIGELSDKEKETRRKNWKNLKKKTDNNIQPAFQLTATVQPDNFIEVSEEVVTTDTSEFSEPVADLVEVQIQQTPEPHHTVLHQWVKELEKSRVQAEKKMAAATVMFAEAASKIAEATLMNAETNRMNAETNRKQFEVMKAIMDVVGKPGQPSSARFRAKDQSENEITVFCPKCNTEVLRTLRQEEARNADKRQEAPDNRPRARKISRQTDSSSEADSSDANDDDNELSSNCHDEEPEIEVGSTAVKVEPIDIEVHKEQAHTDPISLDVKTEPRDDEVDNTNETHALNEPTGTKRKGRKIPTKEVTLRQHEGVCSEKQNLQRKS